MSARDHLARVKALLALDRVPPEGYEPDEPERPALVMHNADVSWDFTTHTWDWFCEGCWKAADGYRDQSSAQRDADAHNEQAIP